MLLQSVSVSGTLRNIVREAALIHVKVSLNEVCSLPLAMTFQSIPFPPTVVKQEWGGGGESFLIKGFEKRGSIARLYLCFRHILVRAAIILHKANLPVLILDHVLQREETSVIHPNRHLAREC